MRFRIWERRCWTWETRTQRRCPRKRKPIARQLQLLWYNRNPSWSRSLKNQFKGIACTYNALRRIGDNSNPPQRALSVWFLTVGSPEDVIHTHLLYSTFGMDDNLAVKSAMRSVAGSVSRRQGCPPWGGIQRKLDAREKSFGGQSIGSTNRDLIEGRITK